ncbi:MAG: tetratricopeptide repeat protein [Smithella sp.]|jgi:tetratricopeptide (TPR) repeat protein
MSYINDALRKAQKDKKSTYAAYEPILSAAGQTTKRPRRWLFIIGLMLFLWTAGVIALQYWPEEKKVPVTPLKVAGAPIAATEVGQAVKETPAENKNESLLKNQTAPAQIKTEPGITDAGKLYTQAIKKHREGKLEEAKSLYKKVIKIDPQNIEALNNLGVVYMKKKVYKWAIIRLNDAIKVKHNYADAHYNLACIYAQQNDTDRSLAYLKKAVRFNPEVRGWAENDNDLKVMNNLPEFKKLLEKK